MGLIDFIKSFKKCEHKKNYRMRKFFSGDGTPWIEFNCFDCDHSDSGHVYAEKDDWEEEFKLVKNDEIVHHTKGDKVLVD